MLEPRNKHLYLIQNVIRLIHIFMKILHQSNFKTWYYEKRKMSFTCLKEMSRFIWNCFPNDWSEVFDVCFFSTFSFYHSHCISILFWRQQSITFQIRRKRIEFILIMVLLLKYNISKRIHSVWYQCAFEVLNDNKLYYST